MNARGWSIVVLATMILLLFAVPTALAGSGTSVSERAATTPAFSQSLIGANAADEPLRSGGVYWQGQRLGFEDPNGTIASDRVVLREYDAGDDELGAYVREVPLDDEPHVIDADDLRGTYVLTPGDRRDVAIAFDDGTADELVDVENASPFELVEQTLDIRWRDDQPATAGAELELDLESNRDRYNVNVSAEGFEYGDLESAFLGERLTRSEGAPHTDLAPFADGHHTYDAYADEDVLVLRGYGDGTLVAELDRVDAVPESITVEVTDTGVRESVDVARESPPVAGEVELTDASVHEEFVDAGEPITLSATVENARDTRAVVPVEFVLDDQVVAAVETTVGAGASSTASVTVDAPDEPGGYEYAIRADGDVKEVSITVVDQTVDSDGQIDRTGEKRQPGTNDSEGEAPADDGDPSEDAPDAQSGFGLAIALGGVLLVGLGLARRSE